MRGGHNKITSIKPGDKFGLLTTIRNIGNDGGRNIRWECICVCGKLTKPTACNLRSGNTSSCRCALGRKDAAPKRAFRIYKRQARKRSLSFLLTFEFFTGLVQKPCFYCGIAPQVNGYSTESKYKIPMNGVDRKNNNEGYTEENCVPACGICNKAKLDLSLEVFNDWLQRIVDFRNIL